MASLRRAMLMSKKEEEAKSKAAKEQADASENAKKRPRPASMPFASGKMAAMAKRQKKATTKAKPKNCLNLEK